MPPYLANVLPVRSEETNAGTFSVRRFGAPVKVISSVQVFSTDPPTRLLSNNPRRVAWTIINPDRSYIQILHENNFTSWVSVAGTYRPFRYIAPVIYPEGGSATMSVEDDGEAVMQEVWVGGPSGLSISVFVEEIMAV